MALDDIADSIKKYYEKQRDTIYEYFCNIRCLEEYWNWSSFESLLHKAQEINDKTSQALIGINERYRQYYTKKAEMIRNRPSFNGGASNHKQSVVSSSSNGNFSNSKMLFDKVFKDCNKDITRKIYSYLVKIKFYKPNEKICFYDPDGISKRRLYKNIMAIDINSSTFDQDMLSLTGQQMFFRLQHNQRMHLIRCLGVELHSKSFSNDTQFSELVDQIKTSKGIETKYLSFPDADTKSAFTFFTKAFQATMSNNKNEIDKYKKYLSNSYGNFLEILNNLKNFD